MQCKKCHAENADTTVFCHTCGRKLSTGINKRKTGLAVLGGLIGALMIGVLIFWTSSNNPVNSFKTAIENNNYSEAIDIYNKKIDGTGRRDSEIRIYLLSVIQKIEQELIDEKIDYNDASYRLFFIEKTNYLKLEVQTAKDEIEQINRSKIAFKAGEQLLKDNNLKEALIKLKYVSNLDSTNYMKAQDIIKQRSSEYKSTVLDETKKLADAEKYNEVARLLSGALTILPNDTDIKTKKDLYEKKHEKKLAAELKEEIIKLKKNQKVIVVETSTFDNYEGTYVYIKIKNNSDKEIKNYTVSWMGYDKDGNPVKTSFMFPEFLNTVLEKSNVKPGKTIGYDFGWRLTSLISEPLEATTFIACVKEVTFTDGSTWKNQYYKHWVEEFKEKPLHN